MSREAQQWVASLPLDLGITLAAFRVLDKLADAHHTDTDHAYRNVGKLADELVCSVRTVQRALRQLEQRGLVIVGDQRTLPRTVPGNHQPTAYRLPWRAQVRPMELDLGVTPSDTPEPVDNSARGDRHADVGVTPAVALEHRNLDREEEGESSTRARGCSGDADGQHLWSPRAGRCVLCGARTRTVSA